LKRWRRGEGFLNVDGNGNTGLKPSFSEFLIDFFHSPSFGFGRKEGKGHNEFNRMVGMKKEEREAKSKEIAYVVTLRMGFV